MRLSRRAVVLAAILGSLTVLAVVAARDLAGARSALVAAADRIAAARVEILAGDLDTAGQHLHAAREQVARAARHSDGPLWWAAGRLPLTGPPARVVRRTVDVARSGVVLGLAGIEGDAGTLPGWSFRGTDGAVDLAQLQRAADAVAALPTASLQGARDALAAVDGWLPARLHQARRDVLEAADRALGDVEQARRITAVLPALLGADGPRRYFLAMQNSAELRGTGGLIGFHALLTVDGGRLSLSDVRSEEGIEVAPGTIEVPEDFKRRYGGTGATTLVNNVNLDPDLPTVAPVLLAMVEQVTGVALDGVIALDPVGLAMILRGTGPIDLPGGIPDGRIPDPLAVDALPRVAMIDAYEVFGGPSDARKAFHAALAARSFERLLAADWDVAMARRVAAAVAGRHLQVASTRPAEQVVLEALGVGGRLAARDGDGDLLAVTASNAAGNKQDVHVSHHLTGTIRLAAPTGDGGTVRREATLGMRLTNPLPTDGMDLYIIGSARPGGGGTLDGPRGLNRTWFTVWAPDTATVLAGRDLDGGPIGVTRGRIHDHTAIDHVLETPSASTRGFEVGLAGPVTLRREGDALVYDLTLWRQAKAIPDLVEMAVAVPDGWRVAGAVVDGGGRPALPGLPASDVPVVSATVDSDGVRISGAAWQDVHLTLRMTPR